MKIKEIKIANYLGIENIEISDLDEKGAAFTGSPRKGKTSILDAIVQAVANDSHRDKFVRDEKNPAKIYIKMDNGLEITRSFSADGKKNTDVSVNGLRPKAPETYLKGLLGEKVVMIDPNIMLLKGKEKELSEQIINLLPIKVTRAMAMEWVGESPPVDYDLHGLVVCKDIESLYYDNRTEINREIKTTDGRIETIQNKIPEGYDPQEWRDVVLSETFKEITVATNNNNFRKDAAALIDGESMEIKELKGKYDSALLSIDKSVMDEEKETNVEIQELKKRIEILENQKTQSAKATNKLKEQEKENYELAVLKRKERTTKAKDFLNNTPEIDVASLEEKSLNVEKMKGHLNSYDELQSLLADLKKQKGEAESINKKLQTIRLKPIELLKQSNLPIGNLSIGDNRNILVNNLPINNLSTSEIVELLCDIEIAKTSELQFVCLDKWESLGIDDTEVSDLIKAKFKKAGIQLFYTKVTSGELTISEI